VQSRRTCAATQLRQRVKGGSHDNPTARGQTRPVSALKRTPRSDRLLVSVVPQLADLDPDLPFTSDRF